MNRRQGHAYRDDPTTGLRVYLEDLLMEGILGRKLRPGEVVVFRNGNPADLRPANLQLSGSALRDFHEPSLESLCQA